MRKREDYWMDSNLYLKTVQKQVSVRLRKGICIEVF